jgi:hypothetical protein
MLGQRHLTLTSRHCKAYRPKDLKKSVIQKRRHFAAFFSCSGRPLWQSPHVAGQMRKEVTLAGGTWRGPDAEADRVMNGGGTILPG